MFEVSISKKCIFVQSNRNTDLQRISYKEDIDKIYLSRINQNKKEAVFQKCYIKKLFRNDFANFTGKHICRSHFLNKFAALQSVALLKKTLQHKYFPLNLLQFFGRGFS